MMWPLKSHAAANVATQAHGVVALVEGDSNRTLIADYVVKTGLNVSFLETIEEASKHKADANTALIIFDRDIIETDWKPVVKAMSEWQSRPCILLASSVADAYLFEELIKYGGFDVILKPIEKEELRRLSNLAIAFWQHKHSHDANG